MVSIIIPCYNSGKYISECLNSILAQTYSEWEAICVNDGSTDNTMEFLNQYVMSDNRYKVVSQLNSGVSAARNKALSICRGEYICFVDSDDIVEPNFLTTLLRLVNNETDLAICGFTRSMSLTSSVLSDSIEIDSNKCIEKIFLDKSFNPQICCMLFRHSIIIE